MLQIYFNLVPRQLTTNMYRPFLYLLLIALPTITSCTDPAGKSQRPRVIVSTDIGGTDPDDNQSLIHLMMYSDKVEIEGILSSPYGNGRKQEILRMIDIYEKDYPQLKKHNDKLASPEHLRAVTKQGVIDIAPYKGYSVSTEGSKWIISRAKQTDKGPLWMLVWGGLEDLAQALHDEPEIKNYLRVFWIGGPNKKWSVNSYDYIATHHADLWFVESNATYRGWFMEEANTGGPLSQENYYKNHIKGHGHMGADFFNYYDGQIKMGDTPSLGYLLHGQPEDPTKPSWGGRHTLVSYSSKHIFNQGSTGTDTVPTYGVVEWQFKGPTKVIPSDSACFEVAIEGDTFPGFYIKEGIYAVRYSPKKAGTFRYRTLSDIAELDGLEGEFVSTAPWPAAPNKDDYPLGGNWYSDRT
ncbi:MAG: nucleoside hydrolase-like domain-containing protein, partial [Sphingobacterium sp.]